MKPFVILLTLAASLLPLTAAEKPNILWITSEDNAWNTLGCYGNQQALTPRLDSLARNGLLFQHAYSNAPVCAVARSTILNGVYAPAQGTQHMRSRHPVPARFKPYVSYLRENGYYCTNNSKTDYNIEGSDAALWDQCSRKAHYRNRPGNQPFFAIFNLTVSHESSLFKGTIARNRKNGTIPETPRIKPADVELPPYLPDLPEIRSDIAIYHDTITALDQQVGKILDDLEKAGLADDTIVFYYGDHGGITPRGKRYLEDTGVRIPMLVHVPQKWQALSPFESGSKIKEPVAFVDLAPTLLSLAGLDQPSQMQGRAFLGKNRRAPAEDAAVFLYADRFDEIYGMRRGLTDGRWKYIRTFTPQLPAAPYSFYQFGQAGWTAWKKAWLAGGLDPEFAAIWETPQPVEMLFDTRADPMETRNLATDPAHSEKLAAMRGRLKSKMIEITDTGIIPEPMFSEITGGLPVADYLASRSADLPDLVGLAFTATSRDPGKLPLFVKLAGSKDPVTRYWATRGLLILGKQATPAVETLEKLIKDPQAEIRISAALALHKTGHTKAAVAALLAELTGANNGFAKMSAFNNLMSIDALGTIPDSWIKSTIKNKKSGKYVKRLAEQLKKQRR